MTKYKTLNITLFSLALFITGTLSVFAREHFAPSEGGAVLIPFLDPINSILIVIGIGLVFWLVLKYWESSVGAVLLYFLYGAALLGAFVLFKALVDSSIISIQEGTFEMWSHMIFYLSMLTFFIGATGLTQLTTSTPQQKTFSFTYAILMGALFTILTSALFLSAQPLNFLFNMSFFAIFDLLGIHHFIAFAIAALVSFYVYIIKTKHGSYTAAIATPLLLAFALFSLFHIWELFTESLKLIILSETVIERVEQVIAFLAHTLIIYSFIRMHRVSVAEGKNQRPSTVIIEQ